MKTKLSLLLILLMAVLIQPTIGQEKNPVDEGTLKEWLPTMLGSTNSGNEFYLTFHPCWETTGGTDNFLKVYVSSGVATTVTVKVEAKGYEQQQKTVPNSIIVFNLPPNIGQPYAKSDRELPEDDQVWKKHAVHVYAEDPIICYGVTRFQYTSDGYLAIPVHSLGKEYIIASWTDIGSNTNPGGQFLSSYTSCVSPYDKTKVRFTGGGPSFSKTTTGIGVGESKTYNMNRGDVLLMASIGSYSDLTGSKFTANKNVTAISGNFCSYVPEFTPACDFMIEQELPTFTWGTEYHVTPIYKREKNSWIKIFAKQSGTYIYRDGVLFGELTKGGGAREGECYLSQRVLDDTQEPRPVVISSNKPISVTQYNPGMSDDGVPSDPFQLVLTPIEQFQTEIIFNTPGYQGDGFQENYINIVYEGTPEGTIPDDFEFAKVEDGGVFNWKKMRDVYPDIGLPFSIEIRGKLYYAKTITLPGDGVYKLRSSTPFAAYAYGFSNWDSYGFPTSVALGDLEKPDTVAPICEPMIDCFGVVRDARRGEKPEIMVTDMPDDEEFRSNMATVIMLPFPESFNFRFDKQSFVPGESRDVFWTASVVDLTKEARLITLYRDRRGNQKMDTINYYPYKGKIVLVDEENPEGDFGTLPKGDTKTLDYKIVNESEVNTLEIPYLKLLSDDSGYWTWKRYREEMREDDMEMPEQFKTDQGFELTDMDGNPLNFNIVIPPLGEYPFKVSFTAVTEGTFKDSLGLGEVENCFFGYWLPVKANVGEPVIVVDDWDFGSRRVGKTTGWQDITVKNTGTTELIINDFSGPDLQDGGQDVFRIQGLEIDPNDADSWWTIPPGGQRVFQANFTPFNQITYTDEIVFESNAGTKLDNICQLDGIGIDADLLVEGYDWGRNRIDRPGHPKYDLDPYPVDPTSDPLPLWLKNEGTTDLTIQTVTPRNQLGEWADCFLFGPNKEKWADFAGTFRNMVLQANEEITIEVFFNPTTVGDHQLVLEFTVLDGEGKPTATLKGSGTVPYASTNPVDFGWTFRNDVGNIQKANSTLLNNTSTVAQTANQWDATKDNSFYADDLTIEEIIVLNNGTEISVDPALWGTEGFRYDQAGVGAPLVLTPTDPSYTLNTGEFVAPDRDYPGNIGNFTGTIVFVTDAWEENIECVWTGEGRDQQYYTDIDPFGTCASEQVVANVTYYNNGPEAIDISRVEIQNQNWLADDPLGVDVLSFTMNSTQVYDQAETVADGNTAPQAQPYSMTFLPGLEMTYTCDIVFTYTRNGVEETHTQAFSAEVGKVEGDMNIVIANKTPDVNQAGGVDVAIGYDAVLAGVASNVDRLVFEIEYDQDILMMKVDGNQNPIITPGSGMAGWNVTDIRVENSTDALPALRLGKVIVEFSGNGFTCNASGDLFTCNFNTYLPPHGHTGTSIIRVSNESYRGNQLDDCLTLNATEDDLELNATCVYDLRKLSRPGGTGSIILEEPVPNPASGMSTIDFTLTEDGNASMVLYRYDGKVIETFFSEYKEKGSYQITIDASKLPSGVYGYSLKSGNYQTSKQINVVK